jgi:hypothetical protein
VEPRYRRLTDPFLVPNTPPTPSAAAHRSARSQIAARLRRTASGHEEAPDVDAGDLAAPQTIGQRIGAALSEAGFLPLLVQDGRVVLSGFVVVPTADHGAEVRWVGRLEVDALPYRRTFLGVYLVVLKAAGLDVAYVEDPDEPYLVGRCAEPPDGQHPGSR